MIYSIFLAAARLRDNALPGSRKPTVAKFENPQYLQTTHVHHDGRHQETAKHGVPGTKQLVKNGTTPHNLHGSSPMNAPRTGRVEYLQASSSPVRLSMLVHLI